MCGFFFVLGACFVVWFFVSFPWADPEGGGGQGVWTPPPPPEKSQKLGFLSNTGPDFLKITKLPSHYRPASETPF